MVVHKYILLAFFFISCFVEFDATITEQSISDFNIGLLFASYELEGFCKSPVQFVVAKRNNTGQCQWKISSDVETAKIDNETSLPVVDNIGNCLFSCDYKLEEPRMIAEERITSYFANNPSMKMSDFDLYTYLAPCDRSIRGNLSSCDNETTTAFPKFAGVYFSSNGDSCKGIGQEVLNDAILKSGSVTGLFAAHKNTKIDFQNIQQAVKDINEGKTTLSALRTVSECLYKSAAAYFEQHPAEKQPKEEDKEKDREGETSKVKN